MNDAEKLIRQLAAGNALTSSSEIVELVTEMDLPFTECAGKISLVEPLELLSKERIAAGFSPDIERLVQRLDVHWSVDSTNSYLMDKAAEANFHGAVCVAERQVAGRGRRGRTWVSPFGKNIYLSLGWQMSLSDVQLDGVSLVVGMQVVESLKALGLTEAGLKWPNDVLLNGGKLSGILLEIGAPVKSQAKLVVGIGVNLQMDAQHGDKIDQPYSTTSEVRHLSRNALLSTLISNVFSELRRFAQTGFSPYQHAWKQYDVYDAQPVKIMMGDKTYEGVNTGVDKRGNLVLDTAAGLRTFNAGEVSLRPLS